MSPGIAKISFPISRASFAVISVHDFSPASTTNIPADKPATNSFLTGKL
jgi:hypothetical protein